MAEKQVTLEDLARAEAALTEKRAAQKKAYVDGQKKLETLMPERFHAMAKQLKEGVSRYNGAARLERELRYVESTSVTVRDTNRVGDYVCEVRRDPDFITLALRTLWRLHADDAFVIMVEGVLGPPPDVDHVRLRIMGVFKNDQLRWRITDDGKEVDTPIDELPDRIVAAVATREITRLWATAPFVETVAASRKG